MNLHVDLRRGCVNMPTGAFFHLKSAEMNITFERALTRMYCVIDTNENSKQRAFTWIIKSLEENKYYEIIC